MLVTLRGVDPGVEFGWVRFVVRFRSSPVRQSEVRSGRSEEGGRVICLHSRFRASARRSSTGCRTLNRTTKGLEGNHGTKEQPQKTHVAGCTRVGRSGHRSRHHVWHFGTSLKRHHVQRRTHGLRLVAQRSWLCERMSLPSTKPRQDVVSSEYSFYSSQRWCVCVCACCEPRRSVSGLRNSCSIVRGLTSALENTDQACSHHALGDHLLPPSRISCC